MSPNRLERNELLVHCSDLSSGSGFLILALLGIETGNSTRINGKEVTSTRLRFCHFTAQERYQ